MRIYDIIRGVNSYLESKKSQNFILSRELLESHKTIKMFKKVIKKAKTVVWNGPAGVFEVEQFAIGTKSICETLANLEGATTIIGGGDSAAAAISMGYEKKFSHISTGGGASLEYLEGKTLPGVACLDDK